MGCARSFPGRGGQGQEGPRPPVRPRGPGDNWGGSSLPCQAQPWHPTAPSQGSGGLKGGPMGTPGLCYIPHSQGHLVRGSWRGKTRSLDGVHSFPSLGDGGSGGTPLLPWPQQLCLPALHWKEPGKAPKGPRQGLPWPHSPPTRSSPQIPSHSKSSARTQRIKTLHKHPVCDKNRL